MLAITPGENEACAQLVLRPNNSAGWRGNRLFLLAVTLVTGIVALICLHVGAALILVFCGAELLLVYFALRYVCRQCQRQEVLTFLPYEVVLERGIDAPEQSWKLPRLHTRVVISRDASGRQQVIIESGDNKIQVGRFLVEEERQQLSRNLVNLVNHYRHRYL